MGKFQSRSCRVKFSVEDINVFVKSNRMVPIYFIHLFLACFFFFFFFFFVILEELCGWIYLVHCTYNRSTCTRESACTLRNT